MPNDPLASGIGYGNGGVTPDRHIQGANYLFADGHVKYFISGKSGVYAAVYIKGLDYNGNDIVGTDTNID